MDKKLILIILITGLILGVYYFVELWNAPEPPPYRDYCETAADCVPNRCCHPGEAVNIYYAPDCEGSKGICTLECSAPLDCGYGRIECIQNKCTVVSNN